MVSISKENILEKLALVKDPELRKDLVSLGMISDIIIKNGNIGFSIEVDPKRGPSLEPLRKEAENVVRKIPGVLSVSAVLTAHRGIQNNENTPTTSKAQQPVASTNGKSRDLAPGVKNIIAVASGKGGVGKSTTAINVAISLGLQGLKVGILDADIYGPSLPRMIDVNEKPKSHDGKTLEPIQKYGLKCMSIGFLVPEDTPTIWRGPMVMSALQQMLKDVAWGNLDALVVDMPPGTGDAQLTMSQRVPLAGAVIVSTPQDIALLDARKGLNMFKKVNVPVLGIVENMSTFICPKCGEPTEIFGTGGAKQEALRLGVDFLGGIPLHKDIRTTSDDGTPIVLEFPDSIHSKSYRDIASAIWENASKQRKAPPIIKGL
tara:strand:- start:134 stop:1258 length:1125 start_codon:yes stop_codon:yes gene_type:complete